MKKFTLILPHGELEIFSTDFYGAVVKITEWHTVENFMDEPEVEYESASVSLDKENTLKLIEKLSELVQIER